MGEHLAIYLMKRVALLLIVLLLGATFVFGSFFLVGGDPQHSLIPKGADESARDRIIQEFRLDEPVIVQYVNFMVRFFTGDFPDSIAYHTGADIGSFIYSAAIATIELYLVIAVLGCLLGAFLEQALSRLRIGILRTTSHALAFIVFAAPIGGVGLLLLLLIARYAPSYPIRGGTLAPLLAGIIASAAGFILIARRPNEEKASGVRGLFSGTVKRIMSLLALPERRAALLVLSAWIMAVVLVMEVVFSRNGLGVLLWDSVYARDAPLSMSVAFISIVSMAMIQFVFSVSYAIFIRTQRRTPERAEQASAELAVPATESSAQPIPIEAPKPERGFVGSLLIELISSWRGRIALGLIIVMVVVGAGAPIFATVDDPTSPSNFEMGQPGVGGNPLPPSLDRSPYTGFIHPLGTDNFGRDIYSLIIYGLRPELAVAAAMSAIVVMVGIGNSILAFAFRGEPGFPSFFIRSIANAVSWTLLSITFLVGLVVVTFFDSFWNVSAVVLIAWWAWAPQAIFVLRKTYPRRADQEPIGLGNNLKSDMAGILHISKLMFLITYLSVAAIAFLGLTDAGSIYWGDILWSAYSHSAFANWEWWRVVPPLAATLLLSGSVYIILDALEKAARKHQS